MSDPHSESSPPSERYPFLKPFEAEVYHAVVTAPDWVDLERWAHYTWFIRAREAFEKEVGPNPAHSPTVRMVCGHLLRAPSRKEHYARIRLGSDWMASTAVGKMYECHVALHRPVPRPEGPVCPEFSRRCGRFTLRTFPRRVRRTLQELARRGLVQEHIPDGTSRRGISAAGRPHLYRAASSRAAILAFSPGGTPST